MFPHKMLKTPDTNTEKPLFLARETHETDW
jgi:hypothetical protein